MRYSFINLDRNTERKDFVNSNFKDCVSNGQTISRITAVDGELCDFNDVNILEAIDGKLTPTEKACFISHVMAIESSLNHHEHIFIAEDDVMFSNKTFGVIEHAVNNIDPNAWDIIYTDICLQHINLLVNFFSKRRSYDTDKKIVYFDLAQLIFSGATAYIINDKSKDKVHDLLKQQSLDIPYDLTLRKLIHTERINALMLFPFPTTVSAHADFSQIQTEYTEADFLFNQFRRLLWLDRDIDSVLNNNKQIHYKEYYEKDSGAFCDILRVLMSTKIKTK